MGLFHKSLGLTSLKTQTGESKLWLESKEEKDSLEELFGFLDSDSTVPLRAHPLPPPRHRGMVQLDRSSNLCTDAQGSPFRFSTESRQLPETKFRPKFHRISLIPNGKRIQIQKTKFR